MVSKIGTTEVYRMEKRKDLTHLLSDEARVRKSSPIKTTMKYFSDPDIIFLGAGMPPSDMFPLNSISFTGPNPVLSENDPEKSKDKITTGVIEREKYDLEISTDVPLSRALQYGNSRGQPELVNFLKEHTSIFHKILYEDWDIITTSGSTQAWDASLRVFCNRGDTVLLEEYTYSSSYEATWAQGLNCFPVEMDHNGVIPEKLETTLENWDYSLGRFPKMLYLIPNGQNPTGCTLSNERKPKIVDIANKYDLIVIEDDPYYFLQMNPYQEKTETSSRADFVKSLSKSLLEWDAQGRVIRLESVSKTFAPGCRLGWMVGPKYLLDNYWNFHEVSMQSTCGFAQTIINGLLQRWGQGGYIDWLIELRHNYSLKRDHCLSLCFNNLPKDVCRVDIPTAGMFFMIYIDAEKHPKFQSDFNSDCDSLEAYLYQRFVKNGVLVTCASWFRVGPNVHQHLAFRGTYASVDFDRMSNGIQLLGSVIKDEFAL